MSDETADNLVGVAIFILCALMMGVVTWDYL